MNRFESQQNQPNISPEQLQSLSDLLAKLNSSILNYCNDERVMCLVLRDNLQLLEQVDEQVDYDYYEANLCSLEDVIQYIKEMNNMTKKINKICNFDLITYPTQPYQKTVSQLLIPKDTHKGHPYITIDSKFKLVFQMVVSVESCAYPFCVGVTVVQGELGIF
jgi:hypothetical protein